MAHTILRTRKTPEDLSKSLLGAKGVSCDATRYGKLADRASGEGAFEVKVGASVVQVGLLVHNQQPWLCGSPDGLFATGEGTVLLEIKCPHSIKDSAVIDSTAEVTFVKYLVYEEGRLCLRRTHKYYTQVQVLMYCTSAFNLGECFFFVYTSVDSVIGAVERDNIFLETAIRRLEGSFFSHYLPAIVKEYSS
ncbi:unnamed protein product [Ixodes pacificus]